MSSLSSVTCRTGCGACCIAPSITSPIPGMPEGKPAGVPCVQLLEDRRCALFGKPERPAFCGGLQASTEMCGPDRQHALHWLGRLEALTRPEPPLSPAWHTQPDH
ncbi:YkgJ family cysteine cluster protein [Pseudomethylobacillus aquaticus]|uniref:YkgJ family cysteine cluster protein n=1 Tax=Pseudomethylobacillus aquaticus TaxID=2676064 RepID=A0A3N0V195_9PROT|nr:YkgJ family cysteine cluster protein [Pseudomethylobacillus aquaticus]ROH86324.1 YkgJ family cysteine cluster protein [Pseudomethylobacillus aquaticus]